MANSKMMKLMFGQDLYRGSVNRTGRGLHYVNLEGNQRECQSDGSSA